MLKSESSRTSAGLRICIASLVVVFSAVSVTVVTAQGASAATLSVTNCSDSGPGSLRAEVSTANVGDTISFAPSVTSCSPILITSGPIALTKNLTITGPGANTLAVSGGGTVEVFTVASSVTAAKISGLTIEKGTTGSGTSGTSESTSIPGNNQTESVGGGGNGGNGGGLSNAGSLTLTNDVFAGNTTGSGGTGGNDTVTNAGSDDIISIGVGGNGGSGGGIYNAGTLTLTDDTASGNTTGAGGNGGTEMVTSTGSNDTLAVGGGNGGSGAGIYNAGTMTLTNDTIAGNSTGSAGSGMPDSINASGTGDTIDLVGSVGDGGGIFNDGSATITNATVSANGANGPNSGGDISFGPGTVAIDNTIVANASSGTNCAYLGGTVSDGGYNLDSATSCDLASVDDKTNSNPQVGTLQSNGGQTSTMALSSTSPAIDAIPPGTSGCGTTVTNDQRGVARPQGSGCDIGAYEYGDVAMQSLAASAKKVPTGSNLTYAATVVNAGTVGATGVTLSDTLPTGEKFKSASTSLGTCSASGSTLTCDLGNLGAADTATVTIVVKVKAAKGTKLVDMATVSATTGDTIPGNDSKSVAVKVS
jgi:uncharacterized repeat protein (TIGR01451 family)